jgi:hypothetical protein
MNAIEKLNTGKSADENGIQAEHKGRIGSSPL